MYSSVRKTRSLSICLLMVLSALGPIAISAAADHEEEHDWGENVSLYIESSDGAQEEIFPGWHYLSDGTYNMTIEYEGLEVGSNYSLRWWNHGGINEDYGDLEGVVNSSSVTDTWQMEVSNFDCRWNVDIEVINNTDGAWQYNEGYVFEGDCDEYGSLVPSAEINGTWVSEPDEMEAGDYNMSWGVSSLTAGEEYKLDFWYYLSHDRIYYGDMETGEFDHSWTASGTDETVEWNVSITDFHCTLQTEAVLWQNTSTGWDVVDQYWVGSWSEVIMLPCEDRMTAWLWADLDGDGIEEQNALANHGDRDYRDDYYHDVDCTYNSPTEEWACDDYGDAFPPAVEYYDYCYEYGEDEETGNALLACNNHYPAEHLEAGSYNVTLEIRGLEVGDDYWLSGELWEHGFWSGSNNYYELDFTAPTEEVAETVVLVISNHTCQYGFDLTLHNNLSDGAGNWHNMYLENLGVHVFGPCEETPAPFTLTYDNVVWEPEWQYEEFDECEEIDGGYECWNNGSWGYQEDVPIAFLYDMSGPIAFYAPGFLSSAEIAIEHLNDNQDIYNFSLEEYDTGCDGSTAAIAAQDAVDDGIELVVGALCSGASMGANSILSSYGIPHISPTSSSPDLSDSSSYPGFFRVFASDDMGGHAMADLVRGSNSSSPAVLYSGGDSYLGNIAETFIEDYEDGGGSICAELDVALGETDLSDEAQTLTDDSCDSVVMVTYADTAGPMLTELGDDGWSGEMFTHAVTAYEIGANMNDASDADGLQFVDPAVGASDSERAEAFSEDCDNDSDCSNGIYTYENYDAFSVLAESFLLASAWGMPLEEAIHAVGYGWDGASSVVTFNDDGDVGGNGYDLCDLEYDSSNGSLVSGCDGHWDPPGFYYNANEVIDVYDVINGGSWFEECDDSSGVWICQTWWGWDNPDIDPGNHSMSWNITDLIDGVNYLFEYHVGIDTAMYGWEYGDVSHSFEASGNGQSDATHEIDWFLETDEYTCMVDIRAELWEDEDEDGVGDQPLGFGAYTFDGPCEEPPSPFTLYYDGNEYEVDSINNSDMDHCDEYEDGWECWFDNNGDGYWDEVHWFEDCANGTDGWECLAGWEYPYIDPGNHSMTLDMEGLQAGTSYGLEIDIHIGTQFGSEHEHGSLDFDATSDTYSTSGYIETSNYTCFMFFNVKLFENDTDGWHHFLFEDGFLFMGPCEEQPSPFTLVLEGEEYEPDQNVFTDMDHCEELDGGWECYYDYDGDGWIDDWGWYEDCANGTDGWECIAYEPPQLEAGTYSGWLEVEGLEADGNYVLEWRDRRCAWGGGCEEVEGDWGGPFNYSALWDYNASSEIWTHDNFWIGLDNDTCDYFAEFSLREVEWDDETGDWFATNHLWFEVFHWFGPCEEPESPFTLYVDSNEYEMVPINMTGLDECIFYEDEVFEWFDCWIGYDWDGDGEDDWQDWYTFDECTNGTDGWECVEWMDHPGIDPGNHTMDLDIGDLAVDGSYKINIESGVCEEMIGCEHDWEELIFNATSANEAFSFFLDTDEYTCHVGLDVHLYEVGWDDNGNWWYDRHVYGEHFAFIGPCEERPAPADLYHDGVLWEEIVHYDQFDDCQDRGNNEFECQNEGWGHWEWRQNCEEQADGTWMCEGFRQLPALAPGMHDMLWNVTLIDLAASTSYVFFWETTHCENRLGCEEIDQGEEWWNNSDEYHDISWSLETSNYTCDVEVRGILVDASDGEEEMDEDDLIGIGFYKFRGPCEEPPSPVSLYTDGDLWEFIVHYDQFDDCQDRGNNEFECQNEGWGHWEWRQNCEEQADGTWMCEGWHQAPEIGPGNHSMTWEIEAEANTSYMIMWETYHHMAGEDWQYGSYDADWGTTWTTWNLETYNSTCNLDIHYDLYESIDYDGDGEIDEYFHLWNDWISFRGPCEEPPVPIYLWYDGTEHEQIEGLESWDECQMDYGDYRCWDYDGGDEWYDDCEYSDEDEVWYCIEEEDPDLTEGAHSMVWELTDLEVDVNYTLSWCVEQWSLFYEEDGGCDDESFDATNDWQEIAWDLTVSNYTCEVEILVELSSEVDWFYTYFHFNGPCEVPPMIDITVEIDEDGTMVELGGVPIEVVASNDGGDDLMPEDLVGFTDYHIDAGNHNLTITFHDLVVDDEYEYCVESGEWNSDGEEVDSCESFVADSTTYQVDLMTTVHPEACFWVVAAWLGNESRMVGWFGAVMYGPNFENCQPETNVFEILEELVIEEEYWGDLAEVSDSSVMHVLEQVRILHDDIRMKIDYDFGDGDGSLNESEAMMFDEMISQMFAGQPGWDGNCSTEEDFGPQDFTMNGESASCVTGHMWFENLANGSEGAPAWHIAFDTTYNVTANADGQYIWSYEGDEADDAGGWNATFCGVTSALGYAIEYWTHNGTAMTDCLSILAGELVGPIEVVWGVDTDADGIADANDLDDDGDGVADDQDAFPLDESEWSDNDGDGIGDNADTDDDNDGESDNEDRFPNDPSEWDDTDDDGVGDNADDFPFDPTETTDTDGDGWGDNSDAFPNDGTEWVDTDGDGTGDNADTDADGDGIDDDAEDSDGDGVYDDQDAFPFDANETTDTDGDGVGDNGDAFPNDANETTDTDGDGIGDNSDEDADGDGEPNDLDDFPLNGQESTDTDGDGVGDNEDEFPNDATETTDTDGDGVGDNADTDDDDDGVMDDQDAFPLDATESADTDGDGTGDNADAFPNDPMERQDADGDGVGDNADPFPSNPSEWADSDGDGTGDNSDAFPNDATEIVDSDGDGVGNNADAFPNDSTETKDSDGDGVGDNAQAANVSPPVVVEEEDGGLLPGFSALMGVVSMLGAAVLIAGRRKD